MKRFLPLIALVPLASCATPDKRLLQADASKVKDPRGTIEKNVRKEDESKFFYFDRTSRTVYSLGYNMGGFSFTEANIGLLRNNKPEIFEVAQCAGGKRCSTSSLDACKDLISLPSQVTADRQNEIVSTLKSRGYPVIQVTFLEDDKSSGVEIKYFTECNFIKGDLAENFPDLLPGSEAR